MVFFLFQTYGRLEKQVVCLSHTSMTSMGGHFHDKIVELVKLERNSTLLTTI